jgi:hypothetical protein
MNQTYVDHEVYEWGKKIYSSKEQCCAAIKICYRYFPVINSLTQRGQKKIKFLV